MKARGIKICAGLVGVVLVVVLVAANTPAWKPDAVSVDTEVEFAGRFEYQQSLNTSPQRFEPRFSMIVRNGRVYIRTDHEERNFCTRRCGILTKVDDTYNVSLPVGYTHTSNVVPEPTSWKPVGSLTFWNPQTHRVDNVSSEASGTSIVLPTVLREGRKAADLKPGETAYTTASYIRRTHYGQTRMADQPLAYEPLGLKYGHVIDTSVTRTQAGRLEVKLPKGMLPRTEQGSMGDTLFVPVVVVL